MTWWLLMVISCVLCCLSEARPHEKKHGKLYNDPGYIGYWRPPAINKIYFPEKETKSSETKGDKSVGSDILKSVNLHKIDNEVKAKTTVKSLAKQSPTVVPHHQMQTQHNEDVSPSQAPQRDKEKVKSSNQHMAEENHKITSVKLMIKDEGPSSKWNDQMTEVIKDVYGGQLPYSETDVVLRDDSDQNEAAMKHTQGDIQSQPEATPSRVTKDKIPQKTTQKPNTLSKLKDKSKESVKDDSMVGVIKKIQENRDSDSLPKAVTKHQVRPTQTIKPMVTELPIQKKGLTSAPKQKTERSKVKISSTTAAPSTRPNPPTTRPTRVTPVSDRKNKRKEAKHILSKPHVSCKLDLDCPSGRVCQIGFCVCGDETLCSNHAHAVCGSDGVVYPSHCELHRHACVKQKHIKIDSGEACASQKETPQIIQPARNNKIVRVNKTCSYEQIKVNSDNVFMMCDVSVSFTNDIIDCQAACKNCKAFTYRQNGGVCQVFHDELCVDMLNSLGKNHYIKHCHQTDTNSSCHILEVTPGRSPYMCSKATSTMSTLLDCHDTCLRGHCEAFKFLTNGFCEIYFDKSCIEMLEKGRENYYVRRCADPKDCSYHEVQLPVSTPCEIRSDKMDSFEDCRDGCDDCTAIRYDYNTGDCHIYRQESCVTQKSVNYIKRDCGETNEPVLVRVKRPDDEALTERHLKLKDNDKSGLNLPSEKLNQNQNVPEIKVSLEKVTTGSNGHHLQTPVQTGDYLNSLDPKSLKDKVEEAMFSELCTTQEYVRMKADIMRYHCVRFQEKDCSPTALYGKRDYLASLMFSYYDKNMDNKIIRDELWEVWVTEPFQRMFASCSVMDMFRFENIQDDEIQEDEFLKAFDFELAAYQEEFQEVPTLATVGNGLELRCGISPSSENSHLIWSRHNIDLETISFPGIAVFSDGTLYFENVGVHHIGNWTCFDQYRPGFKQVHMLDVNIPPVVKVSPSTMIIPVSGVDIHLQCQVFGIPTPTVQWQFNDKVIPVTPNHYARIHDNGTLIIKDSNYQRDSGAYKCRATNVAGNNEDIAMVYIQKPNQTDNFYGKHTSRQETFFVFHQKGYNAYNPRGCYTKRQVHSSFGHLKHVPEELDGPIYLCDQQKDCLWGQSVNVKNKFLYIAQPTQHRVVVIESAESMNPVEFINTDQFPTKLYYVEHLDEVWVLCWNSKEDNGGKTIIVIRDASSDIRHRMVHTQPVGYRFDLVQDVFLPPSNDLHHNMQYGYVIHSEQHTLFKIELESMRYTKAVDLEVFDCVPQDVAFIPLGGHIIVRCQQTSSSGSKTLQILIDYITDTPIANMTLSGTPLVSPDSKNVITVDKETGKVNIAKVTGNGEITKVTDVMVDSKVSDMTFIPSNHGHGYNMVLTSQELSEVYSVQLDNGKITTLKDVGEPQKTTLNPFTPVSRAVIGGDIFSKYFATPSKDALMILNGQDLYSVCRLTGLKNPDKIGYNMAALV
ncbi:follistatin-related protein 5-like isoform X2 [Ostrea edulis]|uniref:follistatin-related protein 5-like isoform X2 n=1 Tax=Ostrea edulis TaxID=37623 RepID=UPI0024AEDBF1|nr:follistatin-related protein 5-like isoform X2 [Ostrea edulis]XP_056019707.1 follistatin-related protein 5-like isoform X2 [Ostrea edulis]XP_056019708.1 follistatin-related protein 5-like isoform X2 [Ostrea edulis]XP_056019709.1 follistatin-related protein 5-like isoform X2 [Ostrea edulis]XP_056019710.1 follistatin-related protein 5-like isoform X2 [Ostrea edulis]XP_056019711.1 follistatin-related protein 5-like isoform X2 [Ostrea edulis]